MIKNYKSQGAEKNKTQSSLYMRKVMWKNQEDNCSEKVAEGKKVYQQSFLSA